MPIIVDPITHIIDVPQNYLTPVAAGLYSFDTDQFRKDLSTWSATEEGRAEPFPYSHNTEYSVAGVTYARRVEILSPYSVRFEDTGTLYSVLFEGSNNNIFDQVNGIFVPNNVIPIPQNAAGLQTVSSGSGLTAGEKTSLANIDNVVAHLVEIKGGGFDTLTDSLEQIKDNQSAVSDQDKTDIITGTKTAILGAESFP